MIGKAGRRAEREAAKRQNAKLTPASGAVGEQGDYVVGEFQIENKSTEKDSYRLTRNLLLKCRRRARLHGRLPGLAVQFTDPDGRLRPGESWVLVPEAAFRGLLEGEE